MKVSYHAILSAVWIILLTIQIWWTFSLTTAYNDEIAHILANQNKIMAQYETLKGVGDDVVTQNKETKEALSVLAKNDKDIEEQCMKLLGKHVDNP